MNLSDILAYTFYRNTVQDWLVFAGLLAFAVAVLWLIRIVVLRQLERVAARTHTEADNLVVALIQRTRLFFILFIAFSGVLQTLELPAPARRFSALVAAFALLAQLGIWGSTVIRFAISRWIAQRGAAEPESIALVQAAGLLGRLLLWTVLLLVALQNLGLQITALITGLGIGGIAVALAVQNILGDLLASLSIVLDKPFVVGDFIVIDDQAGTVEHIGLKTTRIRSLGGEQIIVSNADLLSTRVRNFKRMFERRVVFAIGVTYDTPPEKVEAIPRMIREIIQAQSPVRFDRSHFKEYGDSSLNFETVYWVLSSDYNVYMNVHQAINLAVLRRFQHEAIEFAFPTRTVHVQGRLSADGVPPDAALAPRRSEPKMVHE